MTSRKYILAFAMMLASITDGVAKDIAHHEAQRDVFRSDKGEQAAAYDIALKAFPSFGDCVTSPINNTKDVYALRANAITDLAELEVCLFRVATHLKSADQFAAFARRSGFKGILVTPYPAYVLRFYSDNSPGTYISFSTDFEQNLRSFSRPGLQRLWIVGTTTSVVFDADGVPVGIRSTLRGRFRK